MRSDDRLARWLFGLTVGIAAALALAAAIEEPPAGHGRIHPEFPTLQQGGPGEERAAPVLALGWALGAMQIAFFGVCFALGLRTRDDRVPLRRWIALATLVYQGGWALLMASYWAFARDPSGPLWLGFPAPTALLFFVFWPLPLLFVLLYLGAFDRFVLDAAALRRFRELVAERRARADADGG